MYDPSAFLLHFGGRRGTIPNDEHHVAQSASAPRRPDEPGAWERFVQLYTPLIYHWACRAGLQESDAADLVQDVFVLLMCKLPDFDYNRDGSFRAWLRTVTMNLWRTRLRRRSVPTDPAVSPDGVPAPDGIVELAEAEYREHLVRRALELMRTDFEPATWRLLGMRRQRSANGGGGDRVGAERGAVRTAKCRVLARLRQELDGLLS